MNTHIYSSRSLRQQQRLFGFITDFPVDLRDFPAPPDPLHMAQGQDLFPAPVQVIGDKAGLLIYLFLRIGLYTPASVKFTGISTSLPQ